MKNLIQYIHEKLVINKTSKYIKTLDDINWNKNSIIHWKNELGFDPTKLDYQKNQYVWRVMEVFLKYGHVQELFDYLCAGGEGQGNVDQDEWMYGIADIDIDDFLSYNDVSDWDDNNGKDFKKDMGINEKLSINKYTITAYNPDALNGDNELLYSSESDDDNWEDVKEELNYLEDKYYGFLVTQFKQLSEITAKQLERTLYRNSRQLIEDIIDEIVNGKDLGYEIKLICGHLEIDCLNSGSRATYYVYAFDNDENYSKMIDWAGNDLSDEDLYKLIFTEGFISEITFK